MWFSFGSEDIGEELREIKELLMATNADLAEVKANLTEATGEIVAKIDELTAQAGDAVDPALVAEVKSLAQGLADVVPDAPVEPTPEPTPVTGTAVGEAPPLEQNP